MQDEADATLITSSSSTSVENTGVISIPCEAFKSNDGDVIVTASNHTKTEEDVNPCITNGAAVASRTHSDAASEASGSGTAGAAPHISINGVQMGSSVPTEVDIDAIEIVEQAQASRLQQKLQKRKKKKRPPSSISAAAKKLLEVAAAVSAVATAPPPPPPPPPDESLAAEAARHGVQIDDGPRDVALENEAASWAERKEVDDLAKFWDVVTKNPADFTGWTYLLAFVESLEDLDEARKAFQTFLQLYPFCYGYWNRYADLEKHHSNNENAMAIYLKGVDECPLSVDLWIQYINFAHVQLKGQTDYEEHVRRLFQRAVDTVGVDWRSDKLWDAYLVFESTRNPAYCLLVYTQAISTPTEKSRKHFENMRRFVERHQPRQLISLDEFLDHHKTWAARQADQLLAGFMDNSEDADEGEYDEELPPGVEPATKRPKVVGASQAVQRNWAVESLSVDAEEAKAVRELIIARREAIFDATILERRKRKAFENAIRRPYFHVKPLERGQLKNWKEYLDFEINEGNDHRIDALFKRSLVACCLYEEFWLKYAHYLLRKNPEAARAVFKRACTIHLPRRPYIHLAWAAFEEDQRNVEKANSILDTVEKNTPGLAMTIVKRINMYRRLGQTDQVERLFKKAISEAPSTQCKTFFITKFSRYLSKVANKHTEALQLLSDHIEHDKSNTKLYLQLVDLCLSERPVSAAKVIIAFDQAILSCDHLEDRILFSQRKMEFVEDYSPSPFDYFLAYDDHQRLLKEGQLQQATRDKEMNELAKVSGARPDTFQVDGKPLENGFIGPQLPPEPRRELPKPPR